MTLHRECREFGELRECREFGEFREFREFGEFSVFRKIRGFMVFRELSVPKLIAAMEIRTLRTLQTLLL